MDMFVKMLGTHISLTVNFVKPTITVTVKNFRFLTFYFFFNQPPNEDFFNLPLVLNPFVQIYSLAK